MAQASDASCSRRSPGLAATAWKAATAGRPRGREPDTADRMPHRRGAAGGGGPRAVAGGPRREPGVDSGAMNGNGDVFLVSAARTPIGKFAGAFAETPAVEL